MPQLKKENKNVHKKFLKFSTVLLEYENYIKRIIDNEYKNVVTKNIIDCKEIMLKDDLIKRLQEVEKIKKEQEKVRQEIKEQEEKEPTVEPREPVEKDRKEDNEDKKEKKDNNGEETNGSEA